MTTKADRRPVPAEQLALSATDVAALFGIAVGTLGEQVRVDPEFPRPRRFGKLVRWLRRDIERYMQSAAFADSPLIRA